jgi:hypothetical protein
MTKKNDVPFEDKEMENILESLLSTDTTITARTVAKLHPKYNAASSITRHPERKKLLATYQTRQKEYRQWSSRSPKYSKAAIAAMLADKNLKIKELEQQIAYLTASHVAMIRAVGELGGFSKWSQFFEGYNEIRNELARLGAMANADVVNLQDDGRPTTNPSPRHET